LGIETFLEMEFVELVCSPNLQRLTNVLEVNEKNRFLDNLAEMEFVLTKELGCIPNLQILTNVLEENSSLTKLSLENQLDEDTQKKNNMVHCSSVFSINRSMNFAYASANSKRNIGSASEMLFP
jgi:hypothetical protein